MKAAELFVRCLENEGVDRIFGIPAEENIDIDCPVDYEENMKLTEKLGELVCPI